MNLRIRMFAVAAAASVLIASGCAKKTVETTASSEPTTTVSETTAESVQPTGESSQTTEETPFSPRGEYGDGNFKAVVNNVILKNKINVDSAIKNYDGITGLDSGWHGDRWIDVTMWLTELHQYTIEDKYLQCGSPDDRYHVVNGKNDFTITFVPVKEIGEKKNYDGFDVPDEVPMTLVNIEIALGNGFKIVIADDGNDDEFNISGSGRGWFMTHDQIAAAEFVFEHLDNDASTDPISDIFEHKTVIKTNTYTF